MVTMFHDMKMAAKDGTITINLMPKEIHPALQVFDHAGDGKISPMELARAAELYLESKDKAKRMAQLSGVLFAVMLALVGALALMTSSVVENAKEVTTDSSTGITTIKGESTPSATNNILIQQSLDTAYTASHTALNAVNSLYFPVTSTSNTEFSYTISGWKRNPTMGLTFNSVFGDQINISPAGALTITDSTGTVLVSEPATGGRRRRLGYFSALQTSGSFTMMQAGGF
jgi:hypothetical protein